MSRFSAAPLLDDPYAPMLAGGTPRYSRTPRSNATISAPAQRTQTTLSDPNDAPRTTAFRAPMIGGSGPQDQSATGNMMLRSAARIRNDTSAGMLPTGVRNPDYAGIEAPKPITATNGASNAMLAGMWENIKGQYGGANESARTEFHARAHHFGINGRMWLEGMGGDPSSQKIVGQKEIPGERMPVSMLGTDGAGGAPVPGMAASQRGQSIGMSATSYQPITRTDPRLFSQPEARFLTPDQPVSRFTAADTARSRQMEADRLETVGNAKLAAAPVTQRERFQGSLDVAEQQARAAAQGKTTTVIHQGETGKTNANAQTPEERRMALKVGFFEKARQHVIGYDKSMNPIHPTDEQVQASWEALTGETAKPAGESIPQAAASGPKTIASADEYDALPNGTKFIWGGKQYTKGK